jgi:hypothetical protein
VVGQSQANASGQVAVNNSGTANQSQSSERTQTSGTVKRGTGLGVNSRNALVGGADSAHTATSTDAASTGTVVHSSIADSAHFKPLSTTASHNTGSRGMSGLQGIHPGSSATTSSVLNSRSSSGNVGGATHAVIQKK